MRRALPASVVGTALALLSGAAGAQATYGPTQLVPPGERAGELEEVEPLPGEADPPTTRVERTPALPRQTAILERELVLSQEETRRPFEYVALFGLGPAKPWVSTSMELVRLLSSTHGVGLFAGAGQYRESGIHEELTYDVRLASRVAGVSARWHSTSFDHLGVEAALGYAFWKGRVEPQGADEAAEDEDAATKLTSAFDASGTFLGVSLVASWLWESGLTVEWNPVGVRVSRIAKRTVTRESSEVARAIDFAIERPSFYGLTNLKVGYLF